MLFQRKPKNKLNERAKVLDVKLRTDKERARRLEVFGRVALVLILVPAVLAGAWFGCRWLYDQTVQRNPSFALKVIDSQTGGTVPPEQLPLWAGVKVGDNLLTLDLPRIKRELELQPIVESAVVERVLPDTLRLRIYEREPIAQIPILRAGQAGGPMGQVRYFVDEAGWVLMPPEQRVPGAAQGSFNDSLPVLSGVDPLAVRAGFQLDSPKLKYALDLLAEFETSEMVAAADILNVELSEPEVLQVTTGQGSKITFNQQDPRGQFRRWRLIHDYGLQSGRAIASLDLSVTNNLPVRWLEASMVPPAKTKPAKPPRTRKKHV